MGSTLYSPSHLYVVNKNLLNGFTQGDISNFLPNYSKSASNTMAKAFFSFCNHRHNDKNLINEKNRLLEIVNLSPEIAQAHYDLGIVYSKVKDTNHAVEQIKVAISLDDKNYHWYMQLATLLIHNSQTHEAENYLQKAIVIKPEQADAYFELGFLFVNRNRLEEAKKYFKQGIQLDNGNYHYLNELARFLIENNDLDEAKIVLDKSLSVGNEIAATYALLSRLNSKQKDFPNAIKFIKEAIIFDSDNEEYKYRLAHLLFQNKDYIASEKILIHFIQSMPSIIKLAEAHALLSHIYTKNNDYENALLQIEKAIRINEQQPRFFNHLAILLKRMGRTEEADRKKKRL